MTMLERVGSYSNEYFNSLIREYTDKGKAPESHGMNRAIRAYLNTNDLKVNELLVDDMPFMQDIDDFIPTDYQLNANANVTGGMTDAAFTAAGGGPLVMVQQMIVRSEDDIRRISQELYNLMQVGSRAQGRIITA